MSQATLASFEENPEVTRAINRIQAEGRRRARPGRIRSELFLQGEL